MSFEDFSNDEKDVFLSLFGRNSDSEDDECDANKELSNDVTADIDEPAVATESTYRCETNLADGTTPPEIVLLERKHLGIAHQLWPAAGFLCDFFVKNEEILISAATAETPQLASCDHSSNSSTADPQLCILELGAGIGLCGMFIAAMMNKRFRTSVALTDLPEAIEGLNLNVERNNLSSTVQSKVLSWGVSADVEAVMSQFGGRIPLVIAADCVYWECLYEPLFITLKDLIARGCKVIISHVRRWKKDGKFFAMCKKAGYAVTVLVEEVKTVPAEHTGIPTRQVTRIYCIEKQP